MRVFTRFLFVVFAANFEFAGFRKQKKYTAYDRFHGNGPYGEIPTKKEPIRTLGFTSSLSCHIISPDICPWTLSFPQSSQFSSSYALETVRLSDRADNFRGQKINIYFRQMEFVNYISRDRKESTFLSYQTSNLGTCFSASFQNR